MPSPKKRLNQRSNRLQSWLELQNAPTTAIVECARPRAGISSPFRPRLPRKRGKHTGLGEGGFADARIAENNRKLVGRGLQGPDDADGFAVPAEEKVRISLCHGCEAAIRRRVPPQLARPSSR